MQQLTTWADACLLLKSSNVNQIWKLVNEIEPNWKIVLTLEINIYKDESFVELETLMSWSNLDSSVWVKKPKNIDLQIKTCQVSQRTLVVVEVKSSYGPSKLKFTLWNIFLF